MINYYTLCISARDIYTLLLIVGTILIIILNLINIKNINAGKIDKWVERLSLITIGKDGYFDQVRKLCNSSEHKNIMRIKRIYNDHHTYTISHFSYINKDFYSYIYFYLEVFNDKLLIKIKTEQYEDAIKLLNKSELEISEKLYNFQIKKSYKFKKKDIK